MSDGVRRTSVPISLLLCACSALALFVAGEPVGFGPLAWLALVPLLVAVTSVSKVRWAWAYGLVFGLVYFAIELQWIFLFGWMAWSALTVVMALYVSVGTLVAGIVRRIPVAPLFVAGAWVGAELLRDRFPYGGYSWGSVGTTQGSVPGVRWLAGTIGAYGLSFLVALVAAAIAHRFVTGRTSWSSLAIAAVVSMGFVVADLESSSSSRNEGTRPVQLLVVQGNVPRPVAGNQRDAIFNDHVELTRELLAQTTDSPPTRVVVWPEDSLGVGVSPNAYDQVKQLAQSNGVPFLVGRSIVDEEGRFLNLVKHIDSTGKELGTYQKRHPVPFGEYVPISFFRRFVSVLESEIPLDLARGTRTNVFDVEGTKIATPICFESVFPRDFVDFSRKGAEIYVLSTNNASFQRSYASEQHLAHTRMRALETRQWVVQAALSGISASIAPDGEISNRTELFEQDAFAVTVNAKSPTSLYSKTGDLFAELFAVATAIAVVVLGLRRRRNRKISSSV